MVRQSGSYGQDPDKRGEEKGRHVPTAPLRNAIEETFRVSRTNRGSLWNDPQNAETRTGKGEGTMKKDRSFMKTILSAALLVTVSAGASSALRSQESAASYPNMAPIDQYLMTDKNAEIAMARSAAPASISADAEVLVLGRHGYETAVKGKNGFVCLVERSWMSPFDFPQFCNPQIL